MDPKTLKAHLADYKQPSVALASRQLVDSIGGYALTWVALAWAITVSWWLAVPLIVLAALLVVRVFIIFHDCGHSSFFASRKANNFWGYITGVLSFTPYGHWRSQHAQHHGSNGDLDRRGVGDIWTMTVQEYKEATRWRRLAYRAQRHPLVLLGIAPVFVFLFEQRFAAKWASKRERRAVTLCNIGLLVYCTLMALAIGVVPFLILQIAIMALAGAMGVWLFYSQHQFEDVYWARKQDWNFVDAALQGSSFLRLPKVLQWFTGNIGYHHIHHLESRIPNYHLQACHESVPGLEQVPTLGFWHSLRTFQLKLFDEARGQLIGFRQFRQLQRASLV